MYALETCVCSGDRVYAVWTWYMLLGHGICSMEMSSCWIRIYGFGRCLLVGEEYMDMEDVFLLNKNIWIWKMSSCRIRRYGYGRCILVGEEHMNMEDVLLL